MSCQRARQVRIQEINKSGRFWPNGARKKKKKYKGKGKETPPNVQLLAQGYQFREKSIAHCLKYVCKHAIWMWRSIHEEVQKALCGTWNARCVNFNTQYTSFWSALKKNIGGNDWCWLVKFSSWKKLLEVEYLLSPRGPTWLLSQVCLCDPLDCSLPSYMDRGPWDFLGKHTGWVAVSSSRGSSWLRDPTCVSCVSCIGRRILYCWAIGETTFRKAFWSIKYQS